MAATHFSGPVISDNGFEGAFTSTSVELQSNNGNSITLDAPDSLAASWTMLLPPNDGTNGQVLTTDGSGVTTWTTNGAGTVTSIATSGNVNGITLTGGTITSSGTITLGGALSLSGFTGVISNALTGASATPGTNRAIYGKYTTFASGMSSGNLVGVRGEITLGGNATGTAYLYGTQGKIITGSNTIDVGSAYVAGVFGQYDATGATITSGYNCGVASDIFGVSSGTKAIDMFYGQHADGGTINSFFRAYGKATSVFEFDVNGGSQASTSATVSNAAGYLKVKVDGAVRYIALYDTL